MRGVKVPFLTQIFSEKCLRFTTERQVEEYCLFVVQWRIFCTFILPNQRPQEAVDGTDSKLVIEQSIRQISDLLFRVAKPVDDEW